MWRGFTNWTERQRTDLFVRKAKLEGYRSRATYKLQDLNESHHFLRAGSRVLDLGAAPGGWSQFAAKLVQSPLAAPIVFAVDILPIQPIPGVKTLQLDVCQPSIAEKLLEEMGGMCDVLLCDMSGNHTGDGNLDCGVTIELTLEALKIGRKVLKPGGSMTMKVFAGLGEPDHFVYVRPFFGRLDRSKPSASRSESREMYYVGKNWLHGKKKEVRVAVPSVPSPAPSPVLPSDFLQKQTVFAYDNSERLERLGKKEGAK